MRCRIYLAISAIGFLTLADLSWAQQNYVTFSVPVNLSQLSPDLTNVNVRCTIQSAALSGGSAFSIAFLTHNGSGRLVTTATVRVSISTLDISAGANATYTCSLTGQLKSGGGQQGFSANATVSAFRLSPTPAPITGSFSWLDVAPAPTADAPPPPASTAPPGGN